MGAIYLAARASNNFGGPGGAINQINITGCTVDGRISHSACIKIDADASNSITGLQVEGNFCYPGDASGTSASDKSTLGIELYSGTPGTSSIFNFSITGNTVIGENSTGPDIFGISMGGAGCVNGSCAANTLKWCNAFGIETIGTSISVSGNSASACGQWTIDSGSVSVAQIVIEGNVILNPIAPTGTIIAIHVISHVTSGAGPYTISDVIIRSNTISSSSSAATDLIVIESQASGYNISNIQVNGNHLIGPGSGSGCGVGPNTGTVQFVTFQDNYFSNLAIGINQGGTYSRYLFNRFNNVTTQYGTTFPSDAMVVDIDTGDANFTPQTIKIRGFSAPTLDSAGNIVLPGSGGVATALITDGTVPSSPNILALNNANFGLGNGAVVSVNSKFTGFPNWAILSDGTVSTAALFLILGIDRMTVRFGSATNTQGATPGSIGFEVIQGDAVYSGAGYPIDVETSGSRIFAFAGNPNSHVSAAPGSICLDTTGNFYYKNVGTGNTGWVLLNGGLTQLTGDVTAGPGTGSQVATIPAATVTLGKMANLAANSIIGNNTGSSITPIALTISQVLTMLFVTQVANTVYAGPSSGGSSAPGFRNLVAADLPSITTLAVTSLDGMHGSVTITISNSGTGGPQLSCVASGGVEAFTLTQPGASTSFTPSVSGLSSASVSSAFKQQQGKWMDCRMKFTGTGAGTVFTFQLPAAPVSTDEIIYLQALDSGSNNGQWYFTISGTTATSYTSAVSGHAYTFMGQFRYEVA